MRHDTMNQAAVTTFGLDVSDKRTTCCGVDADGRVVKRIDVATTRKGIRKRFQGEDPVRVVFEAGTHSRWMSSLLQELGHEVIVANPRRLAWIFKDDQKSDPVDARKLALLGQARSDLQLISRVYHRSEACQADLAVIKARSALVEVRTKLINLTRQTVKSFGDRLPSATAEAFAKKAADAIPLALEQALRPIVEQIAALTKQIRSYERTIEEISAARYPETEILRQIAGVGPITALAFILTLEDPRKFRTSRSVGAFLGLVPKKDQSGETDKQLRITKAGNQDLRRLLINAAHYILGWRGPDCQLRRYGERIAARGGSIAKKKAVVVVARKLSVLLHHLWLTGELYDPEHTPISRRRRVRKR